MIKFFVLFNMVLTVSFAGAEEFHTQIYKMADYYAGKLNPDSRVCVDGFTGVEPWGQKVYNIFTQALIRKSCGSTKFKVIDCHEVWDDKEFIKLVDQKVRDLDLPSNIEFFIIAGLCESSQKKITIYSCLADMLNTGYKGEHTCTFTKPHEDRIGITLFKIINHEEIFPYPPVSYKIGDEMGFKIYLSQKAYLNIVEMDDQGNAVFVYPHADSKQVCFSGVVELSDLFNTNKFYYEIQPPAGKCSYKVIASAVPLTLTRSLQPNKNGNYFLSVKALEKILETLNQQPPGSWWQKEIEFWIKN